MLTYFDGYTAKTTGYVYNLGYYAPLAIGGTIHIGLSVYGHYTDTEGYSDIENNTDFSIYPNPADDDFTIVLPKLVSIGEIRILDINGRTVNRIHISSDSQTILINTNEYSEGLFFVQFIDRNNSLTKKLIVSH